MPSPPMPIFASPTTVDATCVNRKVGDSKRLSRWQDLLKKMRAEGFP